MLHITNLSVKFANKELLSNISLDIAQGARHLLAGHNGSGKSTLAKNLNGLLVPSSGVIYVNGYDTADDEHIWDVRQSAGMVFQNPDNQLVSAIVEDDGSLTPKIKLSDNSAKITNPGFKTLYRVYVNGKAEADLIALRGEKFDTSKPLTLYHPLERWKSITFENYELRELSVTVVKDGKVCYDFPTVKQIAAYAKQEISTFWEEYIRNDNPHIFKVDLSDELYELKNKMIKEIRGD